MLSECGPSPANCVDLCCQLRKRLLHIFYMAYYNYYFILVHYRIKLYEALRLKDNDVSKGIIAISIGA